MFVLARLPLTTLSGFLKNHLGWMILAGLTLLMLVRERLNFILNEKALKRQ